MSDFRADLDALENLLDRIEAFGRRAAGVAADLEAAGRRLGGHWSGAAADRHAEARRRWTGSHEQLRRAATDLAALVRTAHANYTAASRANARMWA